MGGGRKIKSNEHDTRGSHVICDIYESARRITVDDVIDAAMRANMTILAVMERESSIALVLAESHLTVHMRGLYTAVDVYTCGAPESSSGAIQALLEACGAVRYETCEWVRGEFGTIKLCTI